MFCSHSSGLSRRAILIAIWTPFTGSWRRQWHPTPVLLPRKSHGWRSLVGCSPWGCEESDTTEQLHFHFSLSCIGEGNGNPFHCSCLENSRDGRAWWAAVYGVSQSRTRLIDLAAAAFSLFTSFITNKSNLMNFPLQRAWKIFPFKREHKEEMRV